MPVDLQLKLFDSIVLPIPTYSCEDWGFENCAEIEKVKFTILQENIKSKTNDFKLHGLRGIKTRSFEYPHQCQNDWILVKIKEFKQII